MDSKTLIRPEVREFEPYTPGLGIDEIKQKYGLNNIIKMASNENPLGLSPFVQEIIKNYAVQSFRYPAANNPELCNGIGRYLDIDPAAIFCGNGSDEIIDLLIRITAAPGQNNIVAFEPCFSIYKLQARLCGVEFRQTALNPDFTFDFDALLKLIDHNTRLVFLTNPDNPSGFAATKDDIDHFAAHLPPTCFLVIDEAYIDFATPFSQYSCAELPFKNKQIAVLRTFSKMYGLAGLRLGYGILSPVLADYLRRVRLPFSVNILAEKAGIAALQDTTFQDMTLAIIDKGRKKLNQELKKLNCRVYPSQANFIMLKPPVSAEKVFEELLSRGIIIRPLKSYGLPDLLRISIGTERENQSLVTAMKEILS
ncbi:histidinol-phosphate transaminase [Desulfonatronovibrio magnus]|uniref:histidinol-phosphate transaminase n=1 Tax=Desulfonatronovibrio magnus TaxID=698827 RepID=UPI0005EB709C|nr:histidinol-phosphate transaminase [Desulfonatronovibrio magnus]